MSELFTEIYEPTHIAPWSELFYKYVISSKLDSKAKIYHIFIMFEYSALPTDVINLIFTKAAVFELRPNIKGSVLDYLIKWTTRPIMREYNPLIHWNIDISKIIQTFRNNPSYQYRHFARITKLDENNIIYTYSDLLLGNMISDPNTIKRCTLKFNDMPLHTDFEILDDSHVVNFNHDGKILKYYYNPELPVVPLRGTKFNKWKLDIVYKDITNKSDISLVYGFCHGDVMINH